MVGTKDASRAALDIIGASVMGYEFHALKNDESLIYQTYSKLLDFCEVRFYLLFRRSIPWVKHLPLKPERDMHRSQSILHQQVEKIIKENQESNEKSASRNNQSNQKYTIPSLLTVLLREIQSQNTNLSATKLRDEILTLLFGGHETTAVAMSWCIYLLAEHPEVQDKLRKAVQEIDIYAPSLYDDLNQNTYLGYVVNEILRLKSPVQVTSRENLQDDVFNGVRIPKGTIVVLPLGLLHTDTTVWGDDAEEFKPERWETIQLENDLNADVAVDDSDPSETETSKNPSRKRKIDSFSYIPFNSGPRGCIGRHFAIMEMKVQLAAIIKEFKFFPIKDQKIKGMLSITLRPSPTIKLEVQKVQ